MARTSGVTMATCLATLLLSQCMLDASARTVPAGRMLQQLSSITQPLVGGALVSNSNTNVNNNNNNNNNAGGDGGSNNNNNNNNGYGNGDSNCGGVVSGVTGCGLLVSNSNQNTNNNNNNNNNG